MLRKISRLLCALDYGNFSKAGAKLKENEGENSRKLVISPGLVFLQTRVKVCSRFRMARVLVCSLLAGHRPDKNVHRTAVRHLLVLQA